MRIGEGLRERYQLPQELFDRMHMLLMCLDGESEGARRGYD